MRKDPVSGLYVTKDGLVFKLKGRWRDGTKHLVLAALRDNHGWRAFNGDIPEGMQIDHKNKNRKDNSIDNLQLLTPSENNKKRFDQGYVVWNKNVTGSDYAAHFTHGFHNQFG